MYYTYLTARCKYIDMFLKTNNLRSEPGFDEELMGEYFLD